MTINTSPAINTCILTIRLAIVSWSYSLSWVNYQNSIAVQASSSLVRILENVTHPTLLNIGRKRCQEQRTYHWNYWNISDWNIERKLWKLLTFLGLKYWKKALEITDISLIEILEESYGNYWQISDWNIGIKRWASNKEPTSKITEISMIEICKKIYYTA